MSGRPIKRTLRGHDLTPRPCADPGGSAGGAPGATLDGISRSCTGRRHEGQDVALRRASPRGDVTMRQ